MKPARVPTALAEELDERMEGSKVDVPAETEEPPGPGSTTTEPSSRGRPRGVPRQTS